MTEQSLVSRADGWLTAWVGPQLVMMSGETGSYVSLSESGGRIWELLEKRRSVSSMCDALAEEYDVDRSVARQDVFAFLDELKKQDAIHVETPAVE